MRIAYIILAHERPEIVCRLIKNLLQGDAIVVLHWDAKAGEAPVDYINANLKDFGEKLHFAKRVKCLWGDWSLVQATINSIEKIVESGFSPDYVYLLGGSSDYPIKSRQFFENFLTRNKGTEFIESWPANEVQWVAGGPQQERYEYYYPFNWNAKHFLAVQFLKLQKNLGIKRKFPDGLIPHIGSQWWALTWPTILEIRKLYLNKSIVKFFRSTLIPDEHFFQTLVQAVAPQGAIANYTLTYYQFSGYMKPYIFYERHLFHLISQPFFFARKIGLGANGLRDRLDLVWKGSYACPVSDDRFIGYRTNEYRNFIRANRYGGASWRSIYGDFIAYATMIRKHRPELAQKKKFDKAVKAVTDEWCVNDKWHRPEVIILIAGSSNLLSRFIKKNAAIIRGEKVSFFGEIFSDKEIDFGVGIEEFIGFKRADIRRRDSSRRDFFADIVRAVKGNRIVFCCNIRDSVHVIEELMDLYKLYCVYIKNKPPFEFDEDAMFDQPKSQPHGTLTLVRDEHSDSTFWQEYLNILAPIHIQHIQDQLKSSPAPGSKLVCCEYEKALTTLIDILFNKAS